MGFLKKIMSSSSMKAFCFANYDAVGFDLDHALVKYKLPALYSLEYTGFANFLIKERKYSPELASFNHSYKDFIQKGLILDKQRGNLLKLAADLKIMRAAHGTKLLSKAETAACYGADCKWDLLSGLPQSVAMRSKADPFHNFKDYFDSPGGLLCSRIVEVQDQLHDNRIFQYTYWKDVMDAFISMYEREAFKQQTGSFFPALVSNPEKYVQPCSPSLRNWLQKLHEEKTTFLLSSSNEDFLSFLATYCIGPNWKDYFDVIITFARKPHFYLSNNPFYCVTAHGEGDIIPEDSLVKNCVYSQGNYKGLNTMLSKLTKKDEPKVAYIGDSIIDDIYVPNVYAKWDTIGIVEEMAAEEMINTELKYDAVEEVASSLWGSFFAENIDGKFTKTFFGNIISNHSKLAIPYLEEIANLPINHEFNVTCSGFNNAFYPNLPKCLVKCLEL